MYIASDRARRSLQFLIAFVHNIIIITTFTFPTFYTEMMIGKLEKEKHNFTSNFLSLVWLDLVWSGQRKLFKLFSTPLFPSLLLLYQGSRSKSESEKEPWRKLDFGHNIVLALNDRVHFLNEIERE